MSGVRIPPHSIKKILVKAKTRMASTLKTTNLFTKAKINKPNYFREVQQELKKVNWTTKSELVTCTKIVIGATFVFGIGIYFADLIVKGALNVINIIAKWIGG